MTPNPTNINRVDRGYTHGWNVRVQRNGMAYMRFFSDSVHGGKTKAFAAARKLRTVLRKENPTTDRKHTFTTHRSSTKIIGISCNDESYTGYWYEGTKRCKQTFSINKYGKEKALEHAIEARNMECKIKVAVSITPETKDSWDYDFEDSSL